jgi:hypothetical protein
VAVRKTYQNEEIESQPDGVHDPGAELDVELGVVPGTLLPSELLGQPGAPQR